MEIIKTKTNEQYDEMLSYLFESGFNLREIEGKMYYAKGDQKVEHNQEKNTLNLIGVDSEIKKDLEHLADKNKITNKNYINIHKILESLYVKVSKEVSLGQRLSRTGVMRIVPYDFIKENYPEFLEAYPEINNPNNKK